MSGIESSARMAWNDSISLLRMLRWKVFAFAAENSSIETKMRLLVLYLSVNLMFSPGHLKFSKSFYLAGIRSHLRKVCCAFFSHSTSCSLCWVVSWWSIWLCVLLAASRKHLRLHTFDIVLEMVWYVMYTLNLHTTNTPTKRQWTNELERKKDSSRVKWLTIQARVIKS